MKFWIWIWMILHFHHHPEEYHRVKYLCRYQFSWLVPVCSANIVCLCKWSNVTCGDELSQREASPSLMKQEMGVRKLLLIIGWGSARGWEALQCSLLAPTFASGDDESCLHLMDDDVFTWDRSDHWYHQAWLTIIIEVHWIMKIGVFTNNNIWKLSAQRGKVTW